MGNVRVTVSDSKRVEIVGSELYFHAQVLSYTDYYPFGMEMVGRAWSEGSEYRQGYNGKENDKDFGEGVQDYGARLYDGLVCRWFAVDPLAQKYPAFSPYNYVLNSPNTFIDPNGSFVIPSYHSGLAITEDEYNKLITVLKNMYEIITTNERAMYVISKSTGLTNEEIKAKFQVTIVDPKFDPHTNLQFLKNKGPYIQIQRGGTRCEPPGILTVTKASVENLTESNYKKNYADFMSELEKQDKRLAANYAKHSYEENLLALGITLIHERIHGEDQYRNNKVETGQTDTDPPLIKPVNTKIQWELSLLGHRGDDFALYFFGMHVETPGDLGRKYGISKIWNGEGYMKGLVKNVKLPENDTKIKTFDDILPQKTLFIEKFNFRNPKNEIRKILLKTK